MATHSAIARLWLCSCIALVGALRQPKGWRITEKSKPWASGKFRDGETCTLRRVSMDDFSLKMRGRELDQPLIITGVQGWEALLTWTRRSFRKELGHIQVPIGNSAGTVEMNGHEGSQWTTLREFIDDMRSGHRGSEDCLFTDFARFYGVVGEEDDILREMGNSMATPRNAPWTRTEPAHPMLSLGPPKSGLAFHRHGASLAALVAGRKAWWLFSSKGLPSAIREKTQGLLSAWETLVDDPEKRLPGHGAARCIQQPGEVLYVPPGWYHATINLDEVVAVTRQWNWTPKMRHTKAHATLRSLPNDAESWFLLTEAWCSQIVIKENLPEKKTTGMLKRLLVGALHKILGPFEHKMCSSLTRKLVNDSDAVLAYRHPAVTLLEVAKLKMNIFDQQEEGLQLVFQAWVELQRSYFGSEREQGGNRGVSPRSFTMAGFIIGDALEHTFEEASEAAQNGVHSPIASMAVNLAEDVYRGMAKALPNDAGIHMRLGDFLAKLGRLEEAAESSQMAVHLAEGDLRSDAASSPGKQPHYLAHYRQIHEEISRLGSHATIERSKQEL